MVPHKPILSTLPSWMIAFCLILVSCSAPVESNPASATAASPVVPGQLTPYRSPTGTVTPLPTDPATPTPLPSPTPTPRSHTVAKGEDMFGIALHYGVTLEELKAANPSVNPNFLSIGAVLTVPQSHNPQPSTEPVASTPAPVELSPVRCTPVQDGGVWCFLQAYNPQDRALESVSAMIRLTDSKAQTFITRPAFLLLDRLPASESLPLQAYFPPEDTAQLSGPLLAGADLLTALPGADDGRYLPLKLDKQVVKISQDGLSANAGMEVSLEVENGKAARLWVLAVAYDAQGNVIGARRWENGADNPLVSGEAQTVSFNVYSVSGPIDHVALFAEARP